MGKQERPEKGFGQRVHRRLMVSTNRVRLGNPLPYKLSLFVILIIHPSPPQLTTILLRTLTLFTVFSQVSCGSITVKTRSRRGHNLRIGAIKKFSASRQETRGRSVLVPTLLSLTNFHQQTFLALLSFFVLHHELSKSNFNTSNGQRASQGSLATF